jgi:hypothetical protein
MARSHIASFGRAFVIYRVSTYPVKTALSLGIRDEQHERSLGALR